LYFRCFHHPLHFFLGNWRHPSMHPRIRNRTKIQRNCMLGKDPSCFAWHWNCHYHNLWFSMHLLYNSDCLGIPLRVHLVDFDSTLGEKWMSKVCLLFFDNDTLNVYSNNLDFVGFNLIEIFSRKKMLKISKRIFQIKSTTISKWVMIVITLLFWALWVFMAAIIASGP